MQDPCSGDRSYLARLDVPEEAGDRPVAPGAVDGQIARAYAVVAAHPAVVALRAELGHVRLHEVGQVHPAVARDERLEHNGRLVAEARVAAAGHAVVSVEGGRDELGRLPSVGLAQRVLVVGDLVIPVRGLRRRVGDESANHRPESP